MTFNRRTYGASTRMDVPVVEASRGSSSAPGGAGVLSRAALRHPACGWMASQRPTAPSLGYQPLTDPVILIADGPAGRHQMAHDSAAEVVLFGGIGAPSDDTWNSDGTQ